MAFSDSSKATCSVSSLSSGGYSGGDSEVLSERNSIVSLLDRNTLILSGLPTLTDLP